MTATLNVTNSFNQDIHVMVAERPAYLIADLFTDAALLVSGAGEVRAALTAGMSLPTAVASIADLMQYVRAVRQIANAGVATVPALIAAAERLWDRLTANSITVKPGETQNILTESTLNEFCSPSGILGLLGASTLSMTIATDDKSRQINTQSDIPESWTVTDVGARSPGGVQHDWDGEASTTSRMAMATVGDTVWLAWRDQNSAIWVMPLTLGFWQPPTKLAGRSAMGPALANYQGTLYLVATGAGNDQTLWYSTLGAGGWSAPQSANGSSTYGPACFSFDDRLIMVAGGLDYAVLLSNFYLGSWDTQTQIMNIGSAASPAMASFRNKLYLAWRGSGGDQDLWYTSSPLGYIAPSYAPQAHISSGCSGSPSITVLQDRLYMTWRGVTGDEGLWQSSFEGTVWSPQQKLGDGFSSGIGTAMATDDTDSVIFMCWSGGGTDDTLWWSISDGNKWISPLHVPMFV